MNDILVKIFGIAILGALVCIVLRRQNGDLAMLLRVAVGIVLCIACIVMLTPLVDRIREIAELSGISGVAQDCISMLLRALCVAILSHICATICRDSGEASIAGYAELAGKIEIMLLSLPLFLDILEIAIELIDVT